MCWMRNSRSSIFISFLFIMNCVIRIANLCKKTQTPYASHQIVLASKFRFRGFVFGLSQKEGLCFNKSHLWTI